MATISDIEMRFGTKSDIPFIISVIRDGMREGYFHFEEDTGLSQFGLQLSEAIDRRANGEVCADFLFVFYDQDKPTGFALLTGINGTNGLASHMEIRMFGVVRSEWRKGIGRYMLQSILAATPGHKLEASCLPASIVMARLLIENSFQLTKVSPYGKRTFRR